MRESAVVRGEVAPEDAVTALVGPTPGWHKIRVYLAFTALAAFITEASGFNYPTALFNPLIFVVYGLLFALFLDTLIGARESRFHPWYLCGVLVALITESYLMKVLFYGLQPTDTRVWGFAVGPCLMLVFAWHPLMSFLLPAYLARRLLGLPLAIRTGWGRDLVVALLVPLFFSVFASGIMDQRGWDATSVWGLVGSGGVLLVIVLWLRRLPAVADLRFTVQERRRLWTVTGVVYLFATFTCHNQQPQMPLLPPFWPQVGVTLVVIAIWLMVCRSTARQDDECGHGSTGSCVDFVPVQVPLWTFLAWLIWHLASMIAWLVVLRPSLHTIYAKLLVPVALALILVGLGCAVAAVVGLLSAVWQSRCAPKRQNPV